MTTIFQTKSHLSHWIFPAFAVLFLGFIGTIAYSTHHPLADWNNYRAAVFALLRLEHNPPGLYNPPWIYVPLIPLALLPPAVGSAFIAVLCYLVYWIVIRRLGADNLTAIAFLSMPQIFFLSRNGSIDWLIPLGFILPPWLGLFVVLGKPQIGIGIALYWGVSLLRERGVWYTVKTFAPVTIAYAWFVFIYQPGWGNVVEWNASYWPYGIPLGLALIVFALRHQESNLAILAGPFLAPYLGYYSWPAAMMGLARHKWEMIAAVAGMWIVALLMHHF